MIFELREYSINPGLMPQWIQFMHEKILPYQIQLGVALVASFVSLDNPNQYIWIRRFSNEAERERITQAIYESLHWKENIKPHIDKLLVPNSKKVTSMQATDISPVH